MEVQKTQDVLQPKVLSVTKPSETETQQTKAVAVTADSPQETTTIKTIQGRGTAELPFLDDIDPYSQAYQRLSQQEKQQLDTLLNWNETIIKQPERPAFNPSMPLIDNTRNGYPLQPLQEIQPAFTPQEQGLLKNLLVNGTLTTRSSKGETILSYLYNLTKDDQNKKTNGLKLTRELIYLLQPEDFQAAFKQADKMEYFEKEGKLKQKGVALTGGMGEITQCAVHFTCGAASSQVLMRLLQPAEMVRLLHDMITQDKAELQGNNKKTLRPAEGSLTYHAGKAIYKNEFSWKKEGREDRTDTNIIFQSAIMDKIAIGNWSEYNVEADSGGMLNTIGGNSGGHPLYLSRTLGQLTGKPYTYEHALNPYKTGGIGRFFSNLKSPTTQADLVSSLKSQTQAGKQSIIAYQTNASDQMSLHYVTVVNYNPKTDTYYYIDTGEPREERAKIYTKTGTEMANLLRCVIHPE